MPRLELESPVDVLRLDGLETDDFGVQLLSGISGLGLPPKDVQWAEGAGDGAQARGWRVQARDIDIPLNIVGRDRDDLKYWLSRLAQILGYDNDHYGIDTKPNVFLHFYDDDETKWSCPVEHVGGGDYKHGPDTNGVVDIMLTITLRAGDPFFTRSYPDSIFLYQT